MNKGFSGVIGQEPAAEIFSKAIDSKRLGHTYLFAGPEGVGKLHFALALARVLLCDKGTGCPSERASRAVGQCRSCNWAEKGAHPNLHVNEVPEDKQTISIDTVRQVEDEIAMRPFITGSRIFIFNDADRMDQDAANALLKSLEEPPKDCIFILVTAHPESILPTVVSRCQTIHFYPIKQVILEKFFTDNLKVTQPEARLLAYLSDGSIGSGMRIHSSNILDQRKWLIDSLCADNPFQDISFGMMDYAKSGNASMEKQREKIIQQFKMIGLFLRDILLSGYIKDIFVINQDKAGEIKKWYKAVNTDSVRLAIEQILAGEQYIRLNANITLVTENILLNVSRLLRKAS
ncbi:MAG: DNA polymerase III subunit delta' [Candidatus Brocadiia bacterium]